MATCVSNVLLGVSDVPCNGPVLSPYENKIGGYPDFFPSSSLPALPSCTLCGGFLQLLVQVYCPLEDSVNHRLLHLYCCTQSTCNRTNEGWLALRSEVKYSAMSDVSGSTTNTTGTTIETTTGTTGYHSRPLETKQPPTANKWCSGADDWGEEGEEEEEREKEAETKKEFENDSGIITQSVDDFVQASNLQAGCTPKEPLTGPYYFTPMYMYVVEEPTEWKPSDLKQVEELLQKYKTENEDSFDGPSSLEGIVKRDSQQKSGVSKKELGGSGCEIYEKTVAKHGDRAFHKLKKRLSLCPNQVLRYCWKGEPLLISDSNRPPDPSQITCKTCGSKSVFEFQLMPPLVYLLRLNREGKEGERVCGRDSSSCSGVEFGTVAVYSCSESCWGDDDDGGFREESVWVVADPESELVSKLTKHSVN